MNFPQNFVTYRNLNRKCLQHVHRGQNKFKKNYYSVCLFSYFGYLTNFIKNLKYYYDPDYVNVMSTV